MAKEIDIDSIIASGLKVIDDEIKKMAKTSKEAALTHTVIDSLNICLRLLFQHKKDLRDSSVTEDLQKLDQNEMIALAKQAATYILKDKK